MSRQPISDEDYVCHYWLRGSVPENERNDGPRLDHVSKPEPAWVVDQSKCPFQPNASGPARRRSHSAGDILDTCSRRANDRRRDGIAIFPDPSLLTAHPHSCDKDVRFIFCDLRKHSVVVRTAGLVAEIP